MRIENPKNKFKKGDFVGISTKWGIFRVIGLTDEKDWSKVEFVGISSDIKPCSCDYCLTGGVSSGLVKRATVEKNCSRAKFVKKMEKRRWK